MKVKIVLAKNQSIEDAEEELLKALNFKRSGEIHGDEFSDEVMEEAAQEMIKAHEDILKQTLDEINQVLDEEYE